MKHTETPWTIEERKEQSGGNTIIFRQLCHKSSYGPVCVLTNGLVGPDYRDGDTEAKANAAFIVKACNNFDSLLEGCIAACRMLCTRYTAGELRESEDWAIIDAAIDKTKGE